MFEGVQAKGPLELGEILKRKRVGRRVGEKQVPDDALVQIHQRSKRTGFTDRIKQRGWVDAKNARFHGERSAVRSEGAENHVVGIEILGDAQHCRATKFGVGGKAVTFEFAGAASVGINLLVGVGKTLDGEFFEALA